MILQGEFNHWTQESSPCQGVSTNRELREKRNRERKPEIVGGLNKGTFLKKKRIRIRSKNRFLDP
ncbi:hypothetical protein LEP1GSC060_3702 [Leptospira weilii serovar Ranarum str. ICFT]|uniref:Uncharacterized protein n=1 Tax=Leptospira weilii serovar Ranarum str. ICFT TaxID=1218598 RepID=N1W7E2_9LEPT|nr:hypothetical protein LEP1GSC060_3702 [Leptospira weilii serovar Ranarum str. ICFT]